MGGFTFCCGDMGPVMEAKGTVTNEILEMIEDDPRVCYINADGTGRGGRVQQAQLRYPDRILDVGIQEMNMVTIAAGLAKEGFLPYVQVREHGKSRPRHRQPQPPEPHHRPR